jgi:hypothetical protein
MVVSSNGLERSVCESCGNVSVTFNTDSAGEVSRSAFAREADERQVAAPPHDGRGRRLVSASA